MSKGKFISIEGLDFAGKTGVIERLQKDYPNILFTKAPGGNEISQQLRSLALTVGVSEDARLFMMLAAITHEFNTTVEEALLEGKHVISDRWLDSTKVYQYNQFKDFNIDTSNESIESEICIYLNVSNESIIDRAENERIVDHDNVYDQINIQAINERRRRFNEILNKRDSVFQIDANQDPDAVYRDVRLAVEFGINCQEHHTSNHKTFSEGDRVKINNGNPKVSGVEGNVIRVKASQYNNKPMYQVDVTTDWYMSHELELSK